MPLQCGVTGNVVVSDDILCHNKARLISVMACVGPAVGLYKLNPVYP